MEAIKFLQKIAQERKPIENIEEVREALKMFVCFQAQWNIELITPLSVKKFLSAHKECIDALADQNFGHSCFMFRKSKQERDLEFAEYGFSLDKNRTPSFPPSSTPKPDPRPNPFANSIFGNKGRKIVGFEEPEKPDNNENSNQNPNPENPVNPGENPENTGNEPENNEDGTGDNENGAENNGNEGTGGDNPSEGEEDQEKGSDKENEANPEQNKELKKLIKKNKRIQQEQEKIIKEQAEKMKTLEKNLADLFLNFKRIEMTSMNADSANKETAKITTDLEKKINENQLKNRQMDDINTHEVATLKDQLDALQRENNELKRKVERTEKKVNTPAYEKKEKSVLDKTCIGLSDESDSDSSGSDSEVEEDEDIYKYVEKICSQQAKDFNKDYSYVKKSERWEALKLPKWDLTTYPNALSYLFDVFAPAIDRVFLEPLESVVFLERMFSYEVKTKIRNQVKKEMKKYVLIEERLSRSILVQDPAQRISDLKERFTQRHLECLIFPVIAAQVQSKKASLQPPLWARNKGVQLHEYFEKIKKTLKISMQTSMKKTTETEKRESLKILSEMLLKQNYIQLDQFISEDPELSGFKLGEKFAAKMKTEKIHKLLYFAEMKEKGSKSHIASSNAITLRTSIHQTAEQTPEREYSFSSANRETDSTLSSEVALADKNYIFDDNTKLDWATEMARAAYESSNSDERSEDTMLNSYNNLDLEYLYDSGIEDDEICMETVMKLENYNPEKNREHLSARKMTNSYLFARITFPTSSANSKTERGMIDSGSTADLTKRSTLVRHGLDRFIKNLESPIELCGFNNKVSKIQEYADIRAEIGGRRLNIKFLIVDENTLPSTDILLGMNTLKEIGLWKSMLQYLLNMGEHRKNNFRNKKPFQNRQRNNNNPRNQRRNSYESYRYRKFTNQISCNQLSDVINKTGFVNLNFLKKFDNLDIPKNLPVNQKNTRISYKNVANTDSKGNLKLNLSGKSKNIETVLKVRTVKNFDSQAAQLAVDAGANLTPEMAGVPSEKTWSNIHNKPSDSIYDQNLFCKYLLDLPTDRKLMSLVVFKSIELDPEIQHASLPDFTKHIRNNITPVINSIKVNYSNSEDFNGQAFVKNETVIPAHGYKDILIFMRKTESAEIVATSGCFIKGLKSFDRIHRVKDSPFINVFVTNTSDKDIKLRKNQRFCNLERVNEDKLCEIDQIPYRSSDKLLVDSRELDSLEGSLRNILDQRTVAQALRDLEETLNTPLVSNIPREEKESDPFLSKASKINFSGRRINSNTIFYREKINKEFCNQLVEDHTEDEAVKAYKEEKELEFKEFLETIPSEMRPPFKESKEIWMGEPPGQWSRIKVKPIIIPLKDGAPKVIKPRYRPKYTPEQEKAIDHYVATNLARGVISRTTNSSYLSPIVLVKKPTGAYRFVCDYRVCNQQLFEEVNYVIPEITEILTSISSKTIHTCIDISEAYTRCYLAPSSRTGTAFAVTHNSEWRGIYEYNYLSQGIATAPAIFCNIMEDAMRGLNDICRYFLDDVLISSGAIKNPDGSLRTEKENLLQHAKDCRRVFMRAKQLNFRLSLKKIECCKPMVQYLGYYVGQNKIMPSEKTIKNIEKIREIFKVTSTEKQWERVYGFFGWSQQFIPGYLGDRKKLTKLRKAYQNKKSELSKEEFVKYQNTVGEEYEKIFKKWKNCIISTALTVPEKNDSLTLATDASGTALGWALYTSDGRLVQYGGRTLTDAETRWDIYDLELQAWNREINASVF